MTLFVVSHTHWDREWYLTYQQFRLKLVRLVDRLLDLLAADAEYRCFTLDGQMIILEDYLEVRPEREEALRRYIREGRILVGPWYVQPDEFLVSPEALLRNLLEGERCARPYGAKMHVGYAPDTFGHIGQLPQILMGFGIPTACLQRGLSDEPCELNWEAPDGSRAFLAYLRNGYGNGDGLLFKDYAASSEDLLHAYQSLKPFIKTDQALIMHGTDHMEPVPLTARGLAYAREHIEGIEIRHASLPEYLDTVQAEIASRRIEIPLVKGELRSPKRSPLLPGVLSSRIWIKQRNDQCEKLLERWAEPFSTIASLLEHGSSAAADANGRIERPADILREAWRMLMKCHPHDSICGCSIDAVHDEMVSRFDQVEQVGEEIAAQSLEAITGLIDKRPAGIDCPLSAVVVFNPHAYPWTDRVEATVQLADGQDWIEVRDDRDNVLPYSIQESSTNEMSALDMNRQELTAMITQFQGGEFAGMVARGIDIRHSGKDAWIDLRVANGGMPNLAVVQKAASVLEPVFAEGEVEWFHIRITVLAEMRVAFTAQDVPACGYRTFWVCSAAAVINGAETSSDECTIENEYFRAQASRKDGTLTVFDKRTGVTYPGLHRWVDGGDRGDLYNYCPPEHDRLVSAQVVDLRKVTGEGNQQLQVDTMLDAPVALTPDRIGRSEQTASIHIRSRITLSAGVPRLDVHSEIENPASDHRLRVHFPAPFGIQGADYDDHFQVVHRPAGIPEYDRSWIEQPRPEQPQRSFTDLSDGKTGLMIAVRGLPEVEAISIDGEHSELALTLLRCTGWLSRGDMATRRGDAGPSLETPKAQMLGTWSFDYAITPHAGDWQTAARHAWGFATPLRSVTTTLHPGHLPGKAGFISVDDPEFLVTAVKAAEDRQGWVLRGVSLADRPITIHIETTLPVQSALRARMDETGVTRLSYIPGAPLPVDVQPHEVVTLKFVQDARY